MPVKSFVALIVFAAAVLTAPIAAHAQQAVYGLLEDGTWGWPDGPSSCAANPQTMRFSEDHRDMWYSWTKDIEPVLYHVLYVEGMTLTTLIEGEDRRTDAGDRVMWVLVVEDAQHFCWRRTDWPAGTCTKTLEKCVPTS